MDLVSLADALGRESAMGVARAHKKALGQFMTPPAIARFMAQRMVAGFDASHVRLLEPAAGAGILAAAVVEQLLMRPCRPLQIDLLLYEYDPRLVNVLERLCLRISDACADAGVGLDWKVVQGDFLLSELALSGKPVEGMLVISNPPFLKLNKTTDLRAELHAYAVYGQPNIYSLFMAACARLTGPSGRWCFITPRSWMNGTYFTAARQSLLRHLSIESLHAFESRSEGFEGDAVLQEMVIAWATGRSTSEQRSTIVVTRSQGSVDLGQGALVALPAHQIVGNDAQATLSLPGEGAGLSQGWDATLSTFGLRVSTGPVIAFRAAEYVRERAERGTVPLLWLQHIRQQRIDWPVRKKREHIKATAASAWMLVKNEPMVIMRRFSPKEDPRRVTCAAYLGELPGYVIGLENHLNYIYRPGGAMTAEEARGLSAFLASDLVDHHLRAVAGSTQVNAAELRNLPLPPQAAIERIGRGLPDHPSLVEIDRAVAEALSTSTIKQLAAA